MHGIGVGMLSRSHSALSGSSGYFPSRRRPTDLEALPHRQPLRPFSLALQCKLHPRPRRHVRQAHLWLIATIWSAAVGSRPSSILLGRYAEPITSSAFLSIDSCINDYLPNMYFVPPSHPASTCQEQMVARGRVEVACATDTLVVVERMSACKLLDQV